MTRIDTLVVGGGPAGAAAACGLGAAGRDVVLIERTRAPHHKVCGEFLSVETQAQLRRLGVEPLALGAVAIDEVAIHAGRRAVAARLPFRALSLSRHRLDDALLRRAAACGATVRRGASVQQAGRDGAGWAVRCDDGETVSCDHLVLATGKVGLRGVADVRDASLVGLKMHLRLARPAQRALAGRVELTLLRGGYAGLEFVEDGVANLCLVLPRAIVARLPQGWLPLHDYLVAAAPHLAERLAGAAPLWAKPLAVTCPDAGHLHREPTPDTYRIGDRLAHIPPFTGAGLAIALGSAALAAGHIRRGEPPAAYLAAARRLAARPVRLAGAVSMLAANPVTRALLMGAAAVAPALIGALALATRFPLGDERARRGPLAIG